MNLKPDALEFLADHHWVATAAQLRALGVSEHQLSRARREGVLVSHRRGVVRLASVSPSFEGRALYAQLSVGPHAWVSGPSAAVLYGLRQMPRQRIEVTVDQEWKSRPVVGVRLVHDSWRRDADVVPRADGLRVASPLRMLFGLASQFNRHRFERAAEDAWHKGLVTPAQAAEYLADVRRSGRGGVLRLEEWVRRATVQERPAASGLEQDVVDILVAAGVPEPVRQYPLTLNTGEVIHLDLAWPDVRLAVEPGDTWWHGGDLRMRRDQARDRACAELGWHITRLDEALRTTPMAIGRQLAAIYRRRRVDLGLVAGF